MLKDLCFEVIQTCPNECKFCSSNSSQDKRKIIKFEQFKKTVSHFLENGGIEELSISGGEPLLHPDIFEMIKFSKDNGIRTVLFTSGIKKADEIPEEIKERIKNKCNEDLQEIEEHEPWNDRLKTNVKAYYDRLLIPRSFDALSNQECERLKKLGLDKIAFDWQALDEEIDEDLMGRKGLNTYLMSSIIRASKAGLNVDVHFIPMKPNYREFPDILECLEMSGVQNISILNFVPQGRGLENREDLMLDRQELQEFGEILEKERKNYSGSIRVGIPLNGAISHLCTAGTEKLDIKYDGTVLPCPAFKEMSLEKMKKYGIRLYSIYEDLDKLVLRSGTREVPLCKQVYGFRGNLIEGDEK
ncbi:MAG: radical SAM protein [Clostridia bacterium]|nr:radical SAM protein [Clostridia bacterium]